MVDTHFFKGTVPWGPCPAPFLASVTRQATILYAESSSTMLHNYVKHECVQFTGACPAPALPDRSRLFDQFWALNANAFVRSYNASIFGKT